MHPRVLRCTPDLSPLDARSTPPAPSCDNQKCVQKLPNAPGGGGWVVGRVSPSANSAVGAGSAGAGSPGREEKPVKTLHVTFPTV